MLAATLHHDGLACGNREALFNMGHFHNAICVFNMGVQLDALRNLRACANQAVVFTCVILDDDKGCACGGAHACRAGIAVFDHHAIGKGRHRESSSGNGRHKSRFESHSSTFQ